MGNTKSLVKIEKCEMSHEELKVGGLRDPESKELHIQNFILQPKFYSIPGKCD